MERAALSAIDLDPTDPKAYLRAAKAENDLGRTDVAISLCKRAADIEPNLPAIYANALVYAENGRGRREDGRGRVGDREPAPPRLAERRHRLRRRREGKVARIGKKLADDQPQGRRRPAGQAVADEKYRDLVIRLLWQGQADLDLTVIEPSGTACSATQKRTTGGGVLKSDILEQTTDDRSEVYTAAQAFTGKYKVTVTAALGQAIGNKAHGHGDQVRRHRQAGGEAVQRRPEQHEADHVHPGRRHPDGPGHGDAEEMSEPRLLSDRPRRRAPTGVAGGFGGADAATQTMHNPASAQEHRPAGVHQPQEVRLPSVSPTMPSFRLVEQGGGRRDKAEYGRRRCSPARRWTSRCRRCNCCPAPAGNWSARSASGMCSEPAGRTNAPVRAARPVW